jgi:hypothetical protein
MQEQEATVPVQIDDLSETASVNATDNTLGRPGGPMKEGMYWVKVEFD